MKRAHFDYRIKKIELPEFALLMGNAMRENSMLMYGEGVDLTHIMSRKDSLKATMDALNNSETNIIYEAAFEWNDVFVRVDVLRRVSDYEWDIIEVKSGKKISERHLLDISIQKEIAVNSDMIEVHGCYLAVINPEFIFDGNSYENILEEHKVGIGKKLLWGSARLEEFIEILKSDIIENDIAPAVETGPQCRSPSPCSYIHLCHKYTAEVPISILPRVGNKLAKEWANRNVFDLREIPRESLNKPHLQRIWDCHVENKSWKDPQIKIVLQNLAWPRYFIDFETIQQTKPLILNTKPLDAVPFQWSVHCWEEEHAELEEGQSFLQYLGSDIHVNFLTSLLQAVGTSGPIFVHNVGTERGVLQKLIKREECTHLTDKTNKVISRMIDTLPLTRNHFYSPAMMGSYSLKNIVKAIPTTVQYSGDNGGLVKDGMDAQCAWFHHVDATTNAAKKERYTNDLIEYCAKDTIALVDLIKHLSKD